MTDPAQLQAQLHTVMAEGLMTHADIALVPVLELLSRAEQHYVAARRPTMAKLMVAARDELAEVWNQALAGIETIRRLDRAAAQPTCDDEPPPEPPAAATVPPEEELVFVAEGALVGPRATR